MADSKRALAFNFYKLRHAASRASRKEPLFNRKPQRRSTTSDLEEGVRAEEAAELSPVEHSVTAPVQYRPSRDGDVDGAAGSSERTQVTFDSQATTASSPTLTNNGAAVRNRKVSAEKTGDPAEASAAEEPRKFKKRDTGFFKYVEPKEPYTVGNQIRNTLLNSWVNILLLAVPAGFAVNYAGIDGRIVFAVNFIAIIPLAALLSFGTEEIALRTGETIGGLINATFGNAVELIVAIIALLKGEVEVVQTSLIGSILSNLLLVLGMCFFFGGWERQVQHFNQTVAQTAASLLALAVASNIIPTVFAARATADTSQDSTVDAENIAALSRGTSVILLVVYGAYLYFQLGTHSQVFNEPSQKSEKNPKRKSSREGIDAMIRTTAAVGTATGSNLRDTQNEHILGESKMERHELHDEEEEEEEEKAQLHLLVAFATLVVSTVLVALCAEFMVDGISIITESGVSVEFVGLILLPIVGNAAEHVTAVTVAMKDKMDLAIGVAVGSSMQVSLFLIPFLVIVGWGIGNVDMNLAFDSFQVAVLFVSVLLVNYLIADGESHWLEGFLLICLYFIIAVCSWWYPASSDTV
ncbi:Sodium/calcium exchanger protein-domain-containing protein [Xylariales sp. PMI_506]|nr:Sodium/calcium exchanger protein-domain-containing protein [Xylariales sp. PMI_506]